MRFIGWLLLAFSFSAVIGVRIAGIGLSEVELFMQSWPFWVIMIVIIIGGAYFVKKY